MLNLVLIAQSYDIMSSKLADLLLLICENKIFLNTGLVNFLIIRS